MSVTKRLIRTHGFTLIEILVAVTLLVMVLGIVYGSYSSVVLSVERTRDAAERLKAMQFLVRGFSQNLAQATEGWSPGPAYRPYSAGGGEGGGQDNTGIAESAGDMRFPFMGEIDTGADGTVDSLSFGSTAPMIGGGQLPGQIKMCTYRLEKEKDEEDSEDSEPNKKLSKEERAEADARWLLVLTETPWTPTGETTDQGQGLVTTEQLNKQLGEAAEEIGQKPVSRSTVVYGWDLSYFDGKEWVEEWHSDDVGRLPWSVRVRVKLDREPGEEPTNDLNPEKDPTVIELLFSVPAGAGVHDEAPDYIRPSEREELP